MLNRKAWLLAGLVFLLACRVLAPFTPGDWDLDTLSRQARPPQAAVKFPPATVAGWLPPEGFTTRLHPDGGLYVGDLVSFDVLAEAGRLLPGATLAVRVEGPAPQSLGEVEFAASGRSGRSRAILQWAWDTRGAAPGFYLVGFSIRPGGPQWSEWLELRPAEQLPEVERSAAWRSAESACCTLYYITGTDAERDLAELKALVDRQAQQAREKLGASYAGRVPVVFMPRLLGQGGFTSNEIAVSYLDGNYAGRNTATILHHELIHYLDTQSRESLPPSLFVEGLAVYLSGGHYQPEPLLPRAAALLELGSYIPLSALVRNFYPSQHETGYLEAGSLVAYMVERWGWAALLDFYHDFRPAYPGNGEVDALDSALLRHFSLPFDELETDYLAYLGTQRVSETTREQVRLTLLYYDTMRRYQAALDPSAHYLDTWIPDSAEMRQRGIVADYLRHPAAPLNVALETTLIIAGERLASGDTRAVEALLGSIDQALASTAPWLPFYPSLAAP